MERDGVKIVLGIFFMGILPVLFVYLQKKRGFLWEKDQQRKVIFLLSLANICGVLLWLGNTEMAFAVLMGSTMFHFLVVEGISFIQGKRRSLDENYQLKIKEINKFNRDNKGFIGKMESSDMFFVISFILLLFLCADYLFDQRRVQNVLGRGDGCILVLAGIIYFFLEGRKIGGKILAEEIRKFMRENFWKKICLLLGLEGCIFIGSCLLVDGMIYVSAHSSMFPYTVGFLFLSWCVNFVNIDLSSVGEESSINACSKESIFSITILLGLYAIYENIYISVYEVYDIILFSLISFLMVLPIKIDSRLLGCCRVTAYFALVLYILFR